MKLTIDPKADALYLRLNDAEIVDSQQVAPGVVLDYDTEDTVVGVEMLHVSKRHFRGQRQVIVDPDGSESWLPQVRTKWGG